MTFISSSVHAALQSTVHPAAVLRRASKRAEIKELIHELAKKDPVIEYNIFRSVENVNLRTIIAYKEDGVKHHFLEHYDEWK